MKRTKLSACLLVTLGLVGCKSETGSLLQIINSPAWADDCTLPAQPTLYRSTGLYDPSGSDGYIMTMFLQNHANQDQNPASITGDPNVKPQTNDAQLIGYDYCFYRGDDPNLTAYDPKGKGLLVDCDDVPDDQRGFVPTGATVEAGEGTLSTLTYVLDHRDLRALYGEDFDPIALRNPATYGNPTNATTRSPAWGDFPEATSSTVIVNIRARAKAQSGSTIRSNWFAFPVRVSPASITTFACTSQVVTCADGSAGVQGSRLSTSCGAAYSGGPFTCEDVDTCQ